MDSAQSPDAAIARDYTDLRAHAARLMTLRQQGKSAEAADERSILKAFLDSIFSSGDGRSEKTAWTVYRVADEYVVMGVLGFELEMQALKESGGRSYDVMTCTTETKKKVTVYFDITEHMVAEARRFDQPPDKK